MTSRSKSHEEILRIVGPNGSGKTTLLKTMLGLLTPLEGHVARHDGLSISYVPRRDRIDSNIPITVLEVVLMGLTARSSALHRVGTADQDAALRALGLLGDEALAAATLPHPVPGTAAAGVAGARARGPANGCTRAG